MEVGVLVVYSTAIQGCTAIKALPCAKTRHAKRCARGPITNTEEADSNHEQAFKQVVEIWMAGRDQQNRIEELSKSKALAAMLLLKGAQPWTEAKYKGEEYATLDMDAVNAVQNLRDGRISAAEALVALRQALDSGDKYDKLPHDEKAKG